MKWLRQLWVQVTIGMVAGVLVGWLQPDVGVHLKPLGDAFVALVRVLVGPIVFLTVAHGIATAGDFAKVGRVAVKALVYFEVITLAALVIGLLAVNLTHPGVGMNIDAAALDPKGAAQYVAQAKHANAIDYLLGIIPTTFVGAFTEGSILQVLLVSVLFAFAMTLGKEKAKPVIEMLDALAPIFFRMVNFVMAISPIAAFGAIAFTIAKFGPHSLIQLGGLIAEFWALSALFTLVVLGGVAAACGVNIFRLIGFFREEHLVVAATTSSEAALPALMKKLPQLGIEEEVVGLVIPTSYSFNLDGTCLYLSTVVVFLAQATNTPLPLPQQLALLAVMLLTSKGVAGVAGAALVVLAATLSAHGGVPLVSIAIVVGVHRLLAEGVTFVNVVGNVVAAIVVARWERAVDLDILREKVGFRRRIATPA